MPVIFRDLRHRISPWLTSAILVMGLLIGIGSFTSVSGYLLFERSLALRHQFVVRTRDTQDQRRKEIFDLITDLEARKLTPCSSEFRRFAQARIITSQVIEDIVHLDGDGVSCSAIYTESPYQTLGASPDIDFAPFLYDNGFRIQRGIRFNFAPGQNFTIVSRGDLAVLVHTVAYPATAVNSFSRLSGVNVRRRTGETWVFVGAPVGLSAAELVDGVRLWRGLDHTEISCTADTVTCFVLTMPLRAFLRANVYPLAFFALGGALVGAVAGGRSLFWLYQRRSLSGRLRRALKREELSVLYQPIVDAETGRTVAAEALMRWFPKSGEAVSPALFIPAAEQSGLVHEITCLAVRLVARDMAVLLRRCPAFTVSINIVVDDLLDPDFRVILAQHIEAQGILPSQLAFELTERRQVECGPATEALKALQLAGYRVYIDDFGTGYSNISYLSDLAVDAIKIDQSFTATVATDAVRARLVGPMLDMIGEIGAPVIVEGVENEEQVAFFRAHGVTRMQGWLFGRPQTATRLVASLLDAAGTPRVVEVSMANDAQGQGAS